MPGHKLMAADPLSFTVTGFTLFHVGGDFNRFFEGISKHIPALDEHDWSRSPHLIVLGFNMRYSLACRPEPTDLAYRVLCEYVRASQAPTDLTYVVSRIK